MFEFSMARDKWELSQFRSHAQYVYKRFVWRATPVNMANCMNEWRYVLKYTTIISIIYLLLWTEFFPSSYGPSAKRAGHEDKEGKNEDP